MSLNIYKHIITPIASALALGGVVFTLSGMITSAQTTENFGLADWQFSSAPGTSAPLFRSNDNLTVKVVNLKTNNIVTPADGQFTCTIEARAFQPVSGSGAWTTVAAAGTAYTVANGCSGTFTKAMRASGLNWSFRATVVRVNDSTKSYQFYHNYAYRFEGAGRASGG